MDSGAQRRTCPRCHEVKPADDFLDREGSSICRDCGVKAESDKLDEFDARLRFRREKAIYRFSRRCIAVVAPGHLCGAPASIVDDPRGGMVCEEHAPKD
jgi:hypothetical protein